MIELRAAKTEEIPQLKDIWQRCFGDDPSFVDFFYDNYYKEEDQIVLVEDGAISAMTTILPMDLIFADNSRAKGGYVYALATNPDTQKRGHARELLNYVDFLLKERGLDCVMLVPASASLHRFFDTTGFEECFAHRKVELPFADLANPNPADSYESIDPTNYNRIRCDLLQGQFHIGYNDEMVKFQQEACHMSHGDLYRLMVDGVEGCAAVEFYSHERIVVKELLLPPALIARGMEQIARAIPTTRYHLRTPAFWESLPGSYIQAFAMVKWYNEDLRHAYANQREAYMGLGFD